MDPRKKEIDHLEGEVRRLEAQITAECVEIGRRLAAVERAPIRHEELRKYLASIDTLRRSVEAFRAAFDRPPDRLVEVPAVDASSSEFRRRLAAGEPAAGMVAPAVWAYLRDRKLYPEGG